jgi:hypothetical protein
MDEKKQIVAHAYWWTRVPNFGDAITPYLLRRFASLTDIEPTPIETAEVVSVGSVLEHILPGYTGYIVGSGLLREKSVLKFDPAKAKILALRGPLTVAAIQRDYPEAVAGELALGDPGLLANELIEAQEKQWDLGILPHWQDEELANRFDSLIHEKWTRKVIDPRDDVLTVLRAISSCRRIVTSSLHGMIVADSFGIPRRVEESKKLALDGGMFKFHDYSAAIHCPFETGKMMTPEPNRVDDAKYAVYDAYRELSRAYGTS